MQEIFDKIMNFNIPLNEYLLIGIVAFFVILSLICLLIIYVPRQKMPKVATVAVTSSDNDKKEILPQQIDKAPELNASATETISEKKIEENFFLGADAEKIDNIQTMQGPEGTKVINLADYAVSYTPDLSQPEQEEKVENVVLEGQLSLDDKVVEKEPEEVDDNEISIVTEDGKNFEIVMKKSFQAKLIQSVDEIKEYYADVADYIVSFGLKNRFAWDSSMFIKDKKTLAKIAIRGKTLCLYLALLPKMFIDTKYHAKDVSATKKFEATPLMVKIKSDRGVKFAKALVDEMMKSFNLSCNISFVPKITAKMYPFDTTDKLIEQGLVKLVKKEIKPIPKK